MNILLPHAVCRALDILTSEGYGAYIVGGAVRDFLRGVKPGDFDMTTSALPGEIIDAFSEFRTIPTGISHGTVTVIIDSTPIEITTYRIDGEYADNRHPKSVLFTEALEKDLARRDFTVNAMAYNERVGIVDLFGGRADLKAKLVRAVGVPEERFNEDALRILRALRFASVLNFAIDGLTSEAAWEKKDLLRAVSAERVRVELCKLICGDGAARIIGEFGGIISTAVPGLGEVLATPQSASKTGERIGLIPKKLHLRLAMLLLPVALGGEERVSFCDEVMQSLKFDNKTRERTLSLVRHIDYPLSEDEKELSSVMCSIGEENLFDILALRAAMGYENAKAIESAARRAAGEIKCRTLRDLAIGGRELMKNGFKEGKCVGDALNSLLAAVIAGDVKNDRDSLIAYLSKLKDSK